MRFICHFRTFPSSLSHPLIWTPPKTSWRSLLDAQRAGLPVVRSTGTAQCLLSVGKITEADLKRRLRLLDTDEELQIGPITIRPFPVPHSPGSVGYVLCDGTAAVIYSGDLCLRSHRHSFEYDLLGVIERVGCAAKYL